MTCRESDLCGADDGFADPVASARHHLLGDEHLLCWDLDAQVAAGNHDAVAGLQDLIKPDRTMRNTFSKFRSRRREAASAGRTKSRPPAHALVVLQLADDFDVLALLAQNLPHGVNVARLADERGEDHVDVLLQAELQVLDVLLGQSRQVDGRARQVDALLAAQHATILNLTHQVVVSFTSHPTQRQRSKGIKSATQRVL